MEKDAILRKIAYFLCLSLLLSSCGRKQQIEDDKVRVVAENQRALAEYQLYEGKLLSLGPQAHAAVFSVERQTATAEALAVSLQSEVTDLGAKVRILEAAVERFKPRVESYKAKYSR